MRKKVQELETKKINYRNKLPNLNKCLIKIGMILGSIYSRQAKFKQVVEQE
jgi:hypothetical protein